MPRAKKSAPLTRAECFYVEAHCARKDADALAADLGRPRGLVQAYLDGLGDAGFEPPPPPPRPDPLARAGFAGGKGSVVMTPLGSQIGDEFHVACASGLVPPGNEFYDRRVRNGIHKIRPDEPTR